MSKCCWSNCDLEPVISIGNTINEAKLNMCQNCLDKYNEHCDARRDMFREQGRDKVLKDIERFKFPNPTEVPSLSTLVMNQTLNLIKKNALAVKDEEVKE